jgi:hypothetical protein
MSADDDSRHMSWEQRAAVPAGLVADEPEPARAKTTYAGSGLVINRYGMNPSDVAANARELGWFLVRAGAAADTGGSTASLTDPRAQAVQLYEDLGRLAESSVPQIGALAEVYNTLLEQAKKIAPEDPMIGILLPVDCFTHPRELQALVGQLRLVLGDA